MGKQVEQQWGSSQEKKQENEIGVEEIEAEWQSRTLERRDFLGRTPEGSRIAWMDHVRRESFPDRCGM